VDAERPDLASRALRARLATADLRSRGEVSLLAAMIVAAEAAAGDDGSAVVAMVADLDARGATPSLPPSEAVASLPEALSGASDFFTLVGNEAGAERLLRETLRLAPDDAMAMNNLGYARIEAGHGDAETAAMIERAIELAPQEASILDTVGWLRYRQGILDDDAEGRRRGALTFIEEALAISDTRSAEVLDHYGDVLWRLGRTERAADAWEEAMRLLDDERRRSLIERNLMLIQLNGWGLLVVDPREMYDRDFGEVLRSVRRKLEAVQAGGDPPVAPIFDAPVPDAPEREPDAGVGGAGPAGGGGSGD
jgi:tetratricopeptide (TPR) repeat protein